MTSVVLVVMSKVSSTPNFDYGSELCSSSLSLHPFTSVQLEFEKPQRMQRFYALEALRAFYPRFPLCIAVLK